jgi:hypothetical protein
MVSISLVDGSPLCSFFTSNQLARAKSVTSPDRVAKAFETVLPTLAAESSSEISGSLLMLHI